jgi:D-methionine transport system substrate-binding protein
MGIYSEKVESVDELPDGASVAIPNDPTNGGRALLILADQGFVTLREGAGLKATPADVTENPKNLRLIELDAAQLPRSLADVDAAAINTNYALEAGMSPTDAILREGEKAPYVNIIAVREEDKDAPWVKTLVESYHNDEVKQFVEETFQGAVVPGW